LENLQHWREREDKNEGLAYRKYEGEEKNEGLAFRKYEGEEKERRFSI